MRQRVSDRDGRAQRMPDDDRSAQAEVRVEVADERDPAAERIRPLALRVAEGRQVEREHAVIRREPFADGLPDLHRLDEPPEEDDRAPASAPASPPV